MIKIIILGSTGMMGSTMTKLIKSDKRFQILCTYRDSSKIKLIKIKKNQKKKINIKNFGELKKIINRFNPNYLINCVGLIKQLFKKNNLSDAKYLNSDLPLKLSKLANKKKFKIIHLSTDCVFLVKKEL